MTPRINRKRFPGMHTETIFVGPILLFLVFFALYEANQRVWAMNKTVIRSTTNELYGAGNCTELPCKTGINNFLRTFLLA